MLALQVAEYVNDKLNFVGPVRARTGNEILKGFKACDERQAQLKLPILAVHGTRDRCTSLPVGRFTLQTCCPSRVKGLFCVNDMVA